MVSNTLRFSIKEWQRIVKDNEVKDLSHILPVQFLMINQWMLALVEYQGAVWHAIGLTSSMSSNSTQWVELRKTHEYDTQLK